MRAFDFRFWSRALPSVYDLKPRFQALLRPLVIGLARAGVTANQVTLAAFVMSCVAGLWIWLSAASAASLIALPVVLLARMALNAVDGMLAREHGQASPLGALLNELTDIGADAALYLPFAAIAGLTPERVVVVVTLALIAETAGVLAPMIGAARRYDGPFGKSDRAVFFGFAGLALGLGLIPAGWVDIALLLAGALAALTIVNRCRAALREAAR